MTNANKPSTRSRNTYHTHQYWLHHEPDCHYSFTSVTNTTMGAMLAPEQDNEEKAIYYVSKKVLHYETCYILLERTHLACVYAPLRS